MLVAEKTEYFKREMTEPIARANGLDVSELQSPEDMAWSLTAPMTEREWSKYEQRAKRRLGPYDIAYFGKGLTEYQSCLYAFESAVKDGWTFDGFTLWPLFGKMENNRWERKREIQSLESDDVPMYYFRLALKT